MPAGVALGEVRSSEEIVRNEVRYDMTTPVTPMPFTMRILGRRDPVRFPDEGTGLAALDEFAAERGLAVHYNFGPGHDSAVATAYPFGGDAFMDAVAVLRQEPTTPVRLPFGAVQSGDPELTLAQLLTLFGPQRQLH
jgi:hypothetical protein